MPTYSIPSGYVHKSVRCACMFNSLRICARVLFVLTHEEVLGKWSTGDDKGNSLGSMIYLKFWWPSREPPWCVVYWGRRTWWEVWWWVWPTRKSLKMYDPLGKIFFFFMAHRGTCVNSTHRGGFINSTGIIFFTTHEGVAIMPWTHMGVPSWYCTLLGICLKIWTHRRVLLLTYGPLRDALDTFNPLWML